MRRTRNEIIFQITLLSALTLLTALQTDPLQVRDPIRGSQNVSDTSSVLFYLCNKRLWNEMSPTISCLLLCLFGIRELASATSWSQPIRTQSRWTSTNESGPACSRGTDICFSSAERQPGQQSHRQRGGDHQAVPGNQQQGHQQGGLLQVRYSQASLSLAELLHHFALIGRELHCDEIFSGGETTDQAGPRTVWRSEFTMRPGTRSSTPAAISGTRRNPSGSSSLGAGRLGSPQ